MIQFDFKKTKKGPSQREYFEKLSISKILYTSQGLDSCNFK